MSRSEQQDGLRNEIEQAADCNINVDKLKPKREQLMEEIREDLDSQSSMLISISHDRHHVGYIKNGFRLTTTAVEDYVVEYDSTG